MTAISEEKDGPNTLECWRKDTFVGATPYLLPQLKSVRLDEEWDALNKPIFPTDEGWTISTRKENGVIHVMLNHPDGFQVGRLGGVADHSEDDFALMGNVVTDKLFRRVPTESQGCPMFIRFGRKDGGDWKPADAPLDFRARLNHGIIREFGFRNVENAYADLTRGYQMEAFVQPLRRGRTDQAAVGGYSIDLCLRRNEQTRQSIVESFGMASDSKVFQLKPGAVLPYPWFFFRDETRHLCITPVCCVMLNQLDVLNQWIGENVSEFDAPDGSVILPNELSKFQPAVYVYETLVRATSFVVAGSFDILCNREDLYEENEPSGFWERSLQVLKCCVVELPDLDGSVLQYSAAYWFWRYSDRLVDNILKNVQLNAIEHGDWYMISGIAMLGARVGGVDSQFLLDAQDFLKQTREDDWRPVVADVMVSYGEEFKSRCAEIVSE